MRRWVRSDRLFVGRNPPTNEGGFLHVEVIAPSDIQPLVEAAEELLAALSADEEGPDDAASDAARGKLDRILAPFQTERSGG